MYRSAAARLSSSLSSPATAGVDLTAANAAAVVSKPRRETSLGACRCTSFGCIDFLLVFLRLPLQQGNRVRRRKSSVRNLNPFKPVLHRGLLNRRFSLLCLRIYSDQYLFSREISAF